MALVFALILLGFVLGVVAVVAAQALGLLWILKRIQRKAISDQAKISSTTLSGSSAQIDLHQSLNSAFRKEGVVWILEPEKVSKFWLGKSSREQKRKKEILEVTPIRKYGKIDGDSLFLAEHDGSHTIIQLKGCTVEAISATCLPSKKWAKKYPIKVESKTAMIYHGSKILYVYLETSWEKEAWCKALRLASCDQQERLEWFTQLHVEFLSYLMSLNTEHHSFMRPSVGSSVDVIEKTSKPDGSSSKVRQLFRKITKKTSRVGLDNNRSAWTSLSSREERKNTENLHAGQDAVVASGLMKCSSTGNHLKSPIFDNATPLRSTLSHSRSQSNISVSSDVDVDEKFGIDEGVLCWNLLISRLFFDVKGNAQMKRSIQERIQRTLSNMRTPSYVGEVICTDIDTGHTPPNIIGMRVLPVEMSDVRGFEVDIEYSGSALIEIETRLEPRELELDRGSEEGSNPESRSAGAASSDLLEIEYFGKQLNLAEGMNDLQEPKEDGDWNTDASKNLKSSTSSSPQGSRWKSLLHSVAKQVSQVPLCLAIRVASLRGTLCLQIKPPPSDQLWYGFTFMPDVEFNLESSVGEHKITYSRFALFLINRLKTVIRETFVLPNCESVCIPWMLAEKDDWVPRNIAPFIWIRHESGNETPVPVDTKGSARTSSCNSPDLRLPKPKSSESSQEPARKSDSLTLPSASSSLVVLRSSKSLHDLITPLLENDQTHETTDLSELRTPSLRSNDAHEGSEEKVEDIPVLIQSPSTNAVMDRQISSIEHKDSSPKKIGRRERMLDLRKRVSEKFEEKKRNIVLKIKK